MAVAALLLASSALFAQIIDGTVVDSITGAPVGGASVQIQNSAGRVGYQTSSDPQGAFHIEGVADGTYIALALKSGFQTAGDAAALRPFRVAAGLDPVHLQLSLIPLAKLSGRVFDATDGPVAGANVILLQGTGTGQIVTSDSQGAFSFDGVRPGSYSLSARPPTSLKPPAPTGDQRDGWAKTWFPGVTEASAAQKILIRPGAELVGQDIKLRAVPVHSIRGTIRENGDPAPNLPITVNLPGDLQPIDQHAVSGKDGSFVLPDLSDGTWQLSAEKTTASGATFRAQAAVTITNRDTEGVELQLNAPFSVPVEFVLATQDSTAKTHGNVLIQPEWGGRAPVGSMDKDGNYNIEGVYPGQYRITPVAPSGAYYPAAITLGDRDVLGQPVEFTSGSIPLKVVYRSDGGTIRGTVEECGSATIAIAPEDPVLQHVSSGSSPFTQCTADGHFEFRNLHPGRYYAFAFAQLDQNAADFLSSLPGLIGKAVTTEVTANQTTNVELKVTAAATP
jgi:hypothetical protein